MMYMITSLPTVLYSSYTTAKEPLTFDPDKLIIPNELKGLPVELRICLFNPNGDIKEFSSDMLPSAPATICASANLIGLKMVKALIEELKSRS